ncbi:MAG: HSP90 family protein, partial [Deinococcus sp.]
MEHAFRVDLRGVIDLLANHLYSDASVFIRELLQNAVDAISARHGLGQEFEPEIEVRVGRGPDGLPTLEFRDNGVGLREDEVHEFLSTIGRSSKRISEARGTFLGQFGIGLLSCFMVSAEIELLTQSAHGGPPVRWLARSDGRYRLETLSSPPGLVQPGTTVLLRARQATDFHFGYDGLRGALASYGQILPYPIHVWGDGQYSHVNPALPPWLALAAGDAGRKGEVLAYAREVLGLEALDAIPLCSGVGGVQGVALVLPYSAHPGVRPRHQVYLRRMLLGHDVRNLLPEWAFFVRCLLNVEALHPTASREAFYEDGALDKARAALDTQLRGYIEGLARHDPRRLHALIALHHLPIKALALSDDALYRLLIHEFSFETSTGRRTLGE